MQGFFLDRIFSEQAARCVNNTQGTHKIPQLPRLPSLDDFIKYCFKAVYEDGGLYCKSGMIILLPLATKTNKQSIKHTL